MAKECINCGCKVGFISGEHFGGLLCDNCYNLFGGMALINLETENNPDKYIEAYEKIAETVDVKASSETVKERIKQEFYNYIDARYKRINVKGLGIKEYIQKEEAAKEREIKRVNYARSFNEFYEYDVVTIINEDHGTIDKDKMMEILSDHAKNGWRLHTMYSNELGKKALIILGFGTNSTACEDVLIFERRVADLDE
ncbi:MAG: DUF4177 domain-containing protein [Lachnospiraceae bacterium]|nr:DUF4177 domain-containing protein [Lachnospiraceae bacterium]